MHPYSIILYCTSWVYYFAMLVGLDQEIYDLAIYTGLVWLTSINYWRDPNTSWRYYLDITTVRSGILYHLIRGVDSTNYTMFYIIFITGLVCYIPSRYYYNHKAFIISTIYHALLHIITGVALIYLYTHNIKPLTESYLLNCWEEGVIGEGDIKVICFN